METLTPSVSPRPALLGTPAPGFRSERPLLADTVSRLLWGHSADASLGISAELLAQSARIWRERDWEDDCRWARDAVAELRDVFDRPDADRARVLLALSAYLDELAAGVSASGDPGADPEP